MGWEIPFILTVIFLLLGFLIAWTATQRLGITAGPTVAALVFLPVIVALLFSDRITELRAFGVEAKLRDAAASPVSEDTAGLRISPSLDSEVLGTDATKRNLAREAFFARAGHVVSITVSQWEGLNPEERFKRANDVAVVISNSLFAGGFQALVVLDDDATPLGVYEASFFYDLLRIPLDVLVLSDEYEKFNPTRDSVLAQLQQTQLWIILMAPAERAKLDANKAWVSKRTSRLEVLKIMTEKRYEVMAVTDDQGKYAGVISRNDLISKLLLSSLHSKSN